MRSRAALFMAVVTAWIPCSAQDAGTGSNDPFVSCLLPDRFQVPGPGAGDVIIVGENLDGASVSVDGLPLAVNEISSRVKRVTLPAALATGQHVVTVVNKFGCNTSRSIIVGPTTVEDVMHLFNCLRNDAIPAALKDNIILNAGIGGEWTTRIWNIQRSIMNTQYGVSAQMVRTLAKQAESLDGNPNGVVAGFGNAFSSVISTSIAPLEEAHAELTMLAHNPNKQDPKCPCKLTVQCVEERVLVEVDPAALRQAQGQQLVRLFKDAIGEVFKRSNCLKNAGKAVKDAFKTKATSNLNSIQSGERDAFTDCLPIFEVKGECVATDGGGTSVINICLVIWTFQERAPQVPLAGHERGHGNICAAYWCHDRAFPAVAKKKYKEQVCLEFFDTVKELEDGVNEFLGRTVTAYTRTIFLQESQGLYDTKTDFGGNPLQNTDAAQLLQAAFVISEMLLKIGTEF